MLRIIISIIVLMIIMISFSADKKGAEENKEKTSATTKQVNSLINLSVLNLENLLTSKILSIDVTSGKSVIVVLDKETIRDYNQVNNFEKWLVKKSYDVKVYTIVKGQNKDEAKKWVKEYKIQDALWDSGNMFNTSPVAYYVVNGNVVDKTNKISVGHLRQLVYCEHCGKPKKTANCCQAEAKKKKNNDEKEKVKENHKAKEEKAKEKGKENEEKVKEKGKKEDKKEDKKEEGKR